MADLSNNLGDSAKAAENLVPTETKRQPEMTPSIEPEQVVESRPDAADPSEEPSPEPQEAFVPPAAVAAPSGTASVGKDPVVAQIEDVLAADLTDAFLGMAPDKRAEFKSKGEEIAVRIREMIGQAKENARKIFALIRDWLRMIPGINRFFLEQEAKIKTDRILRLKP
jgi:hypothetical protein